MTTQPMSTRGTITRAALAVALLGLAGALIWVAAIRQSIDQSGAVPSLVLAVLSLVAAGLLFVRPAIGAALATLAALLGAGLGLALNFCLCPMPPLGAEFIALFVAALVVLALALLEFVTLGQGWAAIALVVVVFVLAFSGNPVVLAVGAVVAVVVAVLMLRRRRGSGGGASASGS